MATNPEQATRPESTNQLNEYLRQVVASFRNEHRGDVELLAQFIQVGDQDAFRALVARHGRSVWIACLGQLGDPNDAEDAFQAAFIALARQGATVDARNGLGPWLRAAARRAALKLRRSAGRLGRLRERLVIDAPESTPAVDQCVDQSHTWLLAAAELESLPNRLREPVVMYHLEGRTLAQIAELIGCSIAETHRRVNRGLGVLRERLSARGVVLTAGLLAAIPGGLMLNTAVAATTVARGLLLPSPRVAALTDAILAPRFPTWLIAASAVLLLAAGTAVALVTYPTQKPELPSLPIANSAGPSAALADAPVGPELAPAPRPSSRVFRHDGAVTALAVSPDGKHVASAGADLVIRVWDSATGKQVARFDAPPEGANALTFSPDGSVLVAEDPKIGLAFWNIANGERRENVLGQATGVACLAFNSDGKRMLTIGRNGYLISLDLTRQHGSVLDQKLLEREEATKAFNRYFREESQKVAADDWKGAAYSAAFTSDTRAIYTLDRQLNVARLDTQTHRNVKFNLADLSASVVPPATAIAVSPNGGWLAWGDKYHQIRLFDLVQSKQFYKLRWHNSAVVALAFTPDGRTLASVDVDGLLMRSTTPDPSVRFEASKSHTQFRARVLAFAPDGKRIYGADANGEVYCWDMATLDPIRMIPGK